MGLPSAPMQMHLIYGVGVVSLRSSNVAAGVAGGKAIIGFRAGCAFAAHASRPRIRDRERDARNP